MRLAATENNMAYRTADHERWQAIPFVIGIDIKLSNNHNCVGVPKGRFYDICDELAGRYPKDFKFVGWHPYCRCFAVPVMAKMDEFLDYQRKLIDGEDVADSEFSGKVEEVPDNFDDWVNSNKERAKGWSSMPYFVRQNPRFVKGFEVDTYSKAERKFTRARRTNKAMRVTAEEYLSDLYPALPNTERAAIYHYTQGEKSTFRSLNKHLRKGEQLSDFEEAFSELLSDALGKMDSYSGTVYRAIRLNKTELAKWTTGVKKGEEIQFAGFSSSSKKKSVALEQMTKGYRKNNETDLLIEIESKSGRSLGELSEYNGRSANRPNQHEVLFDKGSRFKLINVENVNGQWVVTLEEI